MSRRGWLGILTALALALSFGLARGATWYPTRDERPRPLLLGAPLLGDGFSIIPLEQLLAAQSGDVTLLFYFSATCPHCIDAGPIVSSLSKRLEKRGIGTLGIASTRNSSMQVGEYKKTFDITFPIYRDSSGAFGLDNDIRSTPSVFLVRKDGSGRELVGLVAGQDVQVEILAVQMAGGDGREVLAQDHYNTPRACATCHVEEYRSWSLTHHSVAFYSLKDAAQRADPKCVGCHVTGWQQPAGFTTVAETPALMHVGCEQCHGVAGGHGKPRPPKGADPVKTWEATCVACHDAKHSIGFTTAKGLPIISHGLNRDIPVAAFDLERRRLEAGEVERPLTAFPDGKIVGSQACASCHAAEHKQWGGGAHAGAVASLTAKGKDKDPACLSCHAVLTDPDRRADPTAWNPGVGCESCHGPGEAHVKAGGGKENIVGLTESCPVCVIEAMCGRCHTMEQDKDFDLERDLPVAGHGKARSP